MYNAVGFNPQPSLLGGLSSKGNVGAYGRGLAYQNAASQGMAAQQKNQQFGVEQMQQQSALRQRENQNNAERSMHGADEKMQGQQLQNRNAVFNTGMNYDYAQMNKQRQTQLLNTLISSAAREF